MAWTGLPQTLPLQPSWCASTPPDGRRNASKAETLQTESEQASFSTVRSKLVPVSLLLLKRKPNASQGSRGEIWLTEQRRWEQKQSGQRGRVSEAAGGAEPEASSSEDRVQERIQVGPGCQAGTHRPGRAGGSWGPRSPASGTDRAERWCCSGQGGCQRPQTPASAGAQETRETRAWVRTGVRVGRVASISDHPPRLTNDCLLTTERSPCSFTNLRKTTQL